MIKGLFFGLISILSAVFGGYLARLNASTEPEIAKVESQEASVSFWESGVLVSPRIRDGTVVEYRTLSIILKTGAESSPILHPIIPMALHEIHQEMVLDNDSSQGQAVMSGSPKLISGEVLKRLTNSFPDSDFRDVIVVNLDKFKPGELRRNLIVEKPSNKDDF